MRLEHLLSVTASMTMRDLGTTPEGHRMDLHLEGTVDPGGRVAGRLAGVDHLVLRGDGVARLNIHAVLDSDAGPVSVHGTGIATPGRDQSTIGRLALTFLTAVPELAWLNRTLAVAETRADRAAGELALQVSTIEV